MNVAFATLGCRVNQYESEAMTEKFIKEGYQIVDFNNFADVYVINTCTVTNMGDKKSRQMIGRARRNNKDAIIAVVGCYSQTSPEEVAGIEGVDVVLGTRNKGEVVYWVNRAKEVKGSIIQVNDVHKNSVFEDLEIDNYQENTRAFLKIQDGCNNYCSYCLIPYARGRVSSKEPKKVIEEVKELSRHGFKEIILSGIHIASYGLDLLEETSLLQILEAVDSIKGIERVRIGSIDPAFFLGNSIDRIVKLKKLCPHFHLSLQSGCDETLNRMNRKYTSEQYKSIVDELRRRIKDVSITTDVITGFPGESQEEFNITFDFLKELKLTKMHIFKYSPRKGTKAAQMKNDVHGTIKEERSNKLIELNTQNENAFISSFIGRSMKVLIEQRSSSFEYSYEGYTSNYIKVIAQSEKEIQCGDILEVYITRVDKGIALGRII